MLPSLSSPSATHTAPSTHHHPLPHLDPQQTLAATFDCNRPLLIHAGAGSGKTRTLTARIVHLLSQGIQPYNILTLSFTRQSAEMLRERVREMLGPADGGKARCLAIKTTHSFGLSLLREYGGAVGLEPNFDVFDTRRVKQTIQTVLIKHDLKYLNQRAVAAYIDMRKLRSWANGVPQDPNGFEPVFQHYQAMLKEQNAIDFADILLKAHALLRGDPSVRNAVRRKYQYILVDEVQDLNELQRDVILALAGDSMRISCVGDPHQSIYGWRGACKDIFSDLGRRVVEPTTLPLSTNYRSAPCIVDVAAAFMHANAVAHHSLQPFDNFSHVEHRSEADELAHHSRWLRQLHEQGFPWNEMAILTRTQQERRIVVNHLRREMIPCGRLKRSSAVSRSAYLRALFAYLRLAADPSDNAAAEVVLTTPKCGVGNGIVYNLKAQAAASGESLLQFLQRLVSNDFSASITQSAKVNRVAKEQITRVVTSVQHICRLLDANAAIDDIVSAALSVTGLQTRAYKSVLDEELKQKPDHFDGNSSDEDGGLFDPAAVLRDFPDDREAANRQAATYTFQPIFSTIKKMRDTQLPVHGIPSIGALLDEFVSLAPSDVYGPEGEQASEAAAPTVSVLTVHAAKGLEWDAVAIHRVNDEEFPCSDDREERRVFYVALTRARRRLLLSSICEGAPRSSRKDSAWRTSPFIKEVQHQVAAKQAVGPS